MRFRFGVVVALVVAMTGCSGDDTSDTGPSAAAPAAEVPAFAQLVAAMPTQDEVDGAQGISRQCPGEPDCPSEPGLEVSSIAFDMGFAGSGADQEAAANASWVSSRATVVVQRHGDPDDAEAVVANLVESAESGPIDRAPVDGDGSYTPGERGEGETGQSQIDGWNATWQVRTTVLIGLDGEESPRIQTAQLQLRRGPAVLLVAVTLDDEGREPTAAHDLTMTLARDYIERLQRATS